jgi:ribosome maturation factor RimP
LAKLKDFEAYRGQRVKIRTHRPRDGRKLFAGRLAEVNGAGVELDDEQSGQRQALNFDEIQVANYEHSFEGKRSRK